jgi:hypothetical protein
MSQSLGSLAANSGMKLLTGAISGITAKSIQAFSILTPEKIQQYTNQARTELGKLFTKCNTPPYNQELDSDAIIKQILCEIKRNEARNNPNLLPSRMFDNLSAIINAYSNDENKYISMKKSVYDNEQTAAAQAIYNYALTNAGLNVAVDATKEAIPSFKSALKPASNASSNPINITQSAIVASGISLANVKTGMVLLKKLNERINKKYIPDFNSLITMLASLEKEKEIALALNDQAKIAKINADMDNVNELILKFCVALDVMQPEEYTQIDGLASNFNEILKNYDLEKYNEAKFNELKAKIDIIMQGKQNQSAAVGNFKNVFGNAATATSNFFGSMKENVINRGRMGGKSKRSRHNRKRKTQKQNKKTHKRRR